VSGINYLMLLTAVALLIDSMNIDSIATGRRPVHSILLGHEIPLSSTCAACPPCQIAEAGFPPCRVYVNGCATFAVRAYVSTRA